MRIGLCVIALTICSVMGVPTQSSFDIRGSLELVDLPPAAIPVEAILVRLHGLRDGFEIPAQPDATGRFVLKNVRPGRYSLTLAVPGRIQTFTIGLRELAPDGFELSSGDVAPLRIVVSLKTSILTVEARGVTGGSGSVIALLAPADPYLTLRESCISNELNGPETTFPFVTPGEYRVFIIDSQFKNDISAYAPRFRDFLKDHSTLVEVSKKGETKVTALYVDGETIKKAVRELGPIH
jgi:hypothetical protein